MDEKNIYISYAFHNKNYIGKLITLLKEKGYNPLLIEPAEDDIILDQAEEMLHKIKASDVFLMIYSKECSDSMIMAIEARQAYADNKKLFVIKLDNSKISDSLQFSLVNAKYAKEVKIDKALSALLGGN